MRSDFDRCFEATFCGNRQMTILHKYQVDRKNDIWHVCTENSSGTYTSGYWKLDRQEFIFERILGMVVEDVTSFPKDPQD